MNDFATLNSARVLLEALLRSEEQRVTLQLVSSFMGQEFILCLEGLQDELDERLDTVQVKRVIPILLDMVVSGKEEVLS